MTIQIHKPELEALIEERLKTGAFENIEDVLLQALISSGVEIKPVQAKRPRPEGKKSLARLFADSPFKGLALDFERFPDNDL
ncbi:MAG: hypothetical protein ACR2NN_15010 [Bryobacteraceae bacterium]